MKETAENLQIAMDEREASEDGALYPMSFMESEAEGNEEAVGAFQSVLTPESLILKLFKVALTNPETRGMERHPYNVCRTCGSNSERLAKACRGCAEANASQEEVI